MKTHGCIRLLFISRCGVHWICLGQRSIATRCRSENAWDVERVRGSSRVWAGRDCPWRGQIVWQCIQLGVMVVLSCWKIAGRLFLWLATTVVVTSVVAPPTIVARWCRGIGHGSGRTRGSSSQGWWFRGAVAACLLMPQHSPSCQGGGRGYILLIMPLIPSKPGVNPL